MPFLKCIKSSINKEKVERTKKHGSRYSIFAPRTKGLFKQRYKGEWKNDTMHGKGTEIDREGWTYEGDWLDGRRHGYGVLSQISKDGSIRKIYAGDWKVGKKDGFGSHWDGNGNYYEGNFHRDKRHGYGRMWYNNCEYYQGFWMDGLPHGEGMLVKVNGNRYVGSFENGKRNGFGTFYHLDTGQRQKGYWHNDVCFNSVMEDIAWRQSALNPTEYAIPQAYVSTICYCH